MNPTAPALCITDLNVGFKHAARPTVRGLNLSVLPGQTLALVGASGSGKTLTCRAVLGLLPATAQANGSIRLDGTELVGLTDPQMRAHRGRGVSMVFQNMDRCLDPTMRIGNQVIEAARLRTGMSRREATACVLDLLDQVQLAAPERVSASYPHQLSGGMRQRVAIAMALAQRPKVLIADEATTALDVTTQATVMRVLAEAQQRTDLAIVLVTHDIALAHTYADDIVAMANGETVPALSAQPTTTPNATRTCTPLAVHADSARHEPAARPLLPAVAELAGSAPGLVHAGAAGLQRRVPVVELTNVTRVAATPRLGQGIEVASALIQGVSLAVGDGETLALVGESGSGKTTIAHTILHAPAPTSGTVRIKGVPLASLSPSERREQLKDIQIVMQDPASSIDPTWKVSAIVAEPLRAFGTGTRNQRRLRAQQALTMVGVDAALWGRRRKELSGGQLQQVAIARALTLSPSMLICDEAVSSLDVATRSRILDLLERLQEDLGLAYLFIAHDLAVVRRIADRVAVTYRGRICETGPTDAVLEAPRHPYTAALQADDPAFADVFNRPQRRATTTGASRAPSPGLGCAFQARCPNATQLCREVEPATRHLTPDHTIACHFPLAQAVAPRTYASATTRDSTAVWKVKR